MNPFLSSDGRLRAGWRFFIAIFVYIGTEVVSASLTLKFFPFGTDPLLQEMLYRPLNLILLLAMFAVMLRLLDRSRAGPLAGQGLPLDSFWLRDLALGGLLGAGLVALAVAVIAAVGSVKFQLLPGSHAAALGLVVFVLATAAMLEEAMFRGYPFQRLVEGVGPVLAVTILSLLFGAIHLRNPHATWIGTTNTVLVGVLFSLAYLKTKALWFPFGMHFAWNAAMGLGFGLPVSGLTMFSVLTLGDATGPVWLTGGNYGIEASITGTAVILLGIAILARMPARPAPDLGINVTFAALSASNDVSSLSPAE